VLQTLLEPSRKQRVPSIDRAGIYARLNDRDNAMKHLNAAFDEHANRMIHLDVEPMTVNLRSDRRFTDLLHRMNLYQ
jgi:hypothetical protein